MKKKEQRIMTVTYCDYCGEEIEGSYHTLHKADKTKLDFCNEIKEGNKHNCLVNFRKDQMAKPSCDCLLGEWCSNCYESKKSMLMGGSVNALTEKKS
jgi:hypothetical protein